MINSIEIKERTWNSEKDHYEIQYKTVTRDEYSGDFDDFILENLNSWDIKNYAEEELDMIDENDVEEKDLDDFHESEMIWNLEKSGYKVIKCQTITDSMRFEKLKEIMEV